MISPDKFIEILSSNGVNSFYGVPDSLLKELLSAVQEKIQGKDHIITANEGNAVALATGSYLATGELSVVYLQNSGLGNIVNPILSLADEKVNAVPMLIIVGWRGELGIKDEPQHIVQGEATIPLLEAMKLSYQILDKDSDPELIIKSAVENAKSASVPVVVLVKKGAFEKFTGSVSDSILQELTRERAVRIVASSIGDRDVVVSSTGKISRELYEFRDAEVEGHDQDFLTVGSMGHTSSIALGVALNKPARRVWCFDGDGALLMHMGALAVIGEQKPKNYYHIVFNNGAHDSVGGQPSAGFSVDFQKMALACGYLSAHSVNAEQDLVQILSKLPTEGPTLLEIKVSKGARADLGRPVSTPLERKAGFMKFLKG